jgi:hypothetical protein
MNTVAEFEPSPSKEILWGVVFWFVIAVVVTYLINRRRQTARLSRITLFLAVWGIVTVIPLLLAIPTGHLALRQIRRSGGTLKGKAQAWFGLVCGYSLVLLLIGCLGFAGGYFNRLYRNHCAEQATVKLIENAKTAWAAANGKKAGDAPTAPELAPFMPGSQFPPPSVEGERYEINPLGVKASFVPPPYQP